MGVSACTYYRAAEVGIAAVCIYDPASEVVCRPTYDPAAGVGISACIRCGYRIVRPLYVASLQFLLDKNGPTFKRRT